MALANATARAEPMSRILSALRRSETRRASAAPVPLRSALLRGDLSSAVRARLSARMAVATIAAVGVLAAAVHFYSYESATPSAAATSQDSSPPNGLRGAPETTAARTMAELANLRIDVLVHAENPGSRFVLINMQRFREGDLIAPETRIEEITASELIVRHRGSRVRLAPRSL